MRYLLLRSLELYGDDFWEAYQLLQHQTNMPKNQRGYSDAEWFEVYVQTYHYVRANLNGARSYSLTDKRQLEAPLIFAMGKDSKSILRYLGKICKDVELMTVMSQVSISSKVEE